MTDIIVVFGTRPEAIKMAPLVLGLRNSARFKTKVCVTAQHRELMDSVLRLFDITPDFDLSIMKPSQSLDELTIGVLSHLGAILDQTKPALILVQATRQPPWLHR